MSKAHCAAIQIERPVATVFAFMADPLALGRWSLGCMNTMATETPGLYTGKSLFDGAQGWLSIASKPDAGLIDYHTGRPEHLRHWISARVAAAEGGTLLMLQSWRPEGMSDERWQRACTCHETEVWLIKCQLEAEA